MNNNEEYEIDLIELVKYWWKRKWAILIPCLIAAILVVAFCVLSLKLPPEKSPLPNKYTSSAKILIQGSSTNSGIQLSGSLSSLANSLGYGSLLSGSKDSPSTTLLTLSQTTTFKDNIINKFDLINKYKIEEHVKTASRKALDKVLTVKMGDSKDEGNNLLVVSFKDTDPDFAKQVVDYSVELLLNTYYELKLRNDLINKQNYETAIAESYQRILGYQKDIQSLENSVTNPSGISSIMLDVQMKKLELEAEEKVYSTFKGNLEMLLIEMSNEPVDLHVIEKAESPDMKSEPSRAVICAVTVLIVGFISCLCLLFKFMQIQKKEQENLFVGKDMEALR